MELKDRIRQIRQNAGLTQQEFAKRIGVSRNTIASYETSVRVPIEAIIVSMCREFDVNENWMRTGEGSIYREMNQDIMLSKWFGSLLKEDGDSFKKQIFLTLSKLSESEWETLKNIMNKFLNEKSQ